MNCAGGLRSSFEEALTSLAGQGVDADGLGLAIGFEFGPLTVTRLGIHGDRVRCSVSRGVLQSEEEQLRCNGTETAIGQSAYDKGSNGVRKMFGSKRKKSNLDYNEAVEGLATAASSELPQPDTIIRPQDPGIGTCVHSRR